MIKWILWFGIGLITVSNSVFSQENVAQSVLELIKQNRYKDALIEAKTKYDTEQNKQDLLSWMLLIQDYSSNTDNSIDYLKDCIKVYSDPNPYIFANWASKLFLGRELDFSDDTPDLYEAIIKSDKINSTIKAYAYEQLAKYCVFKDSEDDYIENMNKVGTLCQWSVAGVFENVSESGFDKNYEPIAKPQPDSKFINKLGTEVQWKKLQNYIPGKWINIALHEDISHSITFAQCFVESPDERTVEIRIGTSGSIKFWLNDELVLQESEERNNGMDTYIARVLLHKGNNRLLIQLGSSEINSMNFACRVMDLNGNFAQGLKYSADYQPYNKTNNSKFEIIKNFAEEFFKLKIQNEPKNILNYILLSKCYLYQDKHSLAYELAKKVDSLMPNNALVTSLLGEIYYRTDNQTMLSQAQESMRLLDPFSFNSLSYEFNELVQMQKFDELDKVINKFHLHIKNPEIVQEKMILQALYLNKLETAFTLLTSMHKKYPDNISFTLLLYHFSLNLQSDEFDPEDILLSYLEEGKNTQIINVLFEYYVNKKKFDKAIDLYEKYLLKYAPESSMYRFKIGDLYFSAMKYSKAIEQYQAALERAPYISFLHSSLGRAYAENGDKDLAIKSFTNAITYNPQNYFARNEIRKLYNKKALMDVVTTPEISSILASAPKISDYPEENSVILLRETVRAAYLGGGSEDRTYLAVKVLNKAGIDTWKEYYIPVTNSVDGVIEKAEIYKKDGKKQKAEVEDSYAVFTNLEPEDVIWIVYTTKNYQLGSLITYFTDEFSFTSSIPIAKAKYSLITEKGVQYKQVLLNSDIKPTIDTTQDYNLISWEKSNIKPVLYEQYMPPYNDIAERIYISSIPSWDFVSKWYANLSAGKAKDDYDVQVAFNSIFPNGYKQLSERERAESIYSYVVKEIRYSSVPFRQSGLIPQKASSTIVTHIGDCKDVSTLFHTLCRKAELQSGLVLIELRNNGNKSMPLPNINFEHAIGYVYIDGQKKYVELTSDLLPFLTIFGPLKNSNALEISSDNTKVSDLFILNPSNHTPNSVIRNTKVSFIQDKMIVDKNCIKYGGPAAGMRSIYRDINTDQRFKELESTITTEYPKVKLLSVDFGKSIATITNSVDYAYKYQVEDVFSEIAGLKILKLPWADAISNNEIVSQSDRKFGLELDYLINADDYSEIIEVEIPNNLKIADLPKDIEQSTKYFDYKLKYVLEGNKLTIKRNLIKKQSLVADTEYQEFLKQLQKVIKTDAAQLAFKAVE